MQAEIKDAFWQVFDTEDLKTPPGPRLVGLIDNRITEMAARYSPTYPAANHAASYGHAPQPPPGTRVHCLQRPPPEAGSGKPAP